MRVERCAVVTQQIEFAVRRADEVVVNLAERGIRKRDKRPERGEFFITGVVVFPRDLRKRQFASEPLAAAAGEIIDADRAREFLQGLVKTRIQIPLLVDKRQQKAEEGGEDEEHREPEGHTELDGPQECELTP